MPIYRFYQLQADGRIAGPAREVECGGDGEALAWAAEAKAANLGIEVWEGARLVTSVFPARRDAAQASPAIGAPEAHA